MTPAPNIPSITLREGERSFHFELNYSVPQANPDSLKNMLLLKNPQFLPNHYETLSKRGTHEDLISFLVLFQFRNG